MLKNNFTLETDRLLLRIWNEADFDAFANYFADEENAKYVGGKKTPEQAWRLMAAYVGHFYLKGYGYLAIEEKSTGALVGCVGLWKSKPWPELEMGYWLLPEMQGKGYATESAQKILEFAFTTLNIKTLVSYINPSNRPSINLAKRLGGKYDKDIQLLNFGLHQVYRYENIYDN